MLEHVITTIPLCWLIISSSLSTWGYAATQAVQHGTPGKHPPSFPAPVAPGRRASPGSSRSVVPICWCYKTPRPWIWWIYPFFGRDGHVEWLSMPTFQVDLTARTLCKVPCSSCGSPGGRESVAASVSACRKISWQLAEPAAGHQQRSRRIWCFSTTTPPLSLSKYKWINIYLYNLYMWGARILQFQYAINSRVWAAINISDHICRNCDHAWL